MNERLQLHLMEVYSAATNLLHWTLQNFTRTTFGFDFKHLGKAWWRAFGKCIL